MSKRERYILWCLVALTSIFPLLFWYQPNHLIYLGDLNYPLNPLLYWLQKLTQTWITSFPGGATHSQAPTLLIYQGMAAVLSLLRVNLAFAQILFYSFWLAASSASFAFFAERLRKRIELGPIFTYVGLVLYQFNIYRMIMFGDAAHNAIYVALPLVLGLLLLAQEKQQARWAALAALGMVVAAPAGANPPMYATFALLLVACLLYFFVSAPHKMSTIKQYGLFILLTGVFNLFWILPFMVGQSSALGNGGLAHNNLANWVDSVSATSSWYNVLRMQGAWDWYAGFNNQPYVEYAKAYQTNPFLIWWAIGLPVMAVVGVLLRRKYWGFSLTILLVGIAGLFLSMGTHEPMTTLYHWLVAHVPLFWIFRSPWYKFGLWQAFATVILVSSACDILAGKARKHFNVPVFLAVLTWTVVFLAAAISVYPFITGLKFPQDKARLVIPEYVLSNSDAIEKSVNGELMLLPSVPAFNYRWSWSGLLDPLFYTTTNALLYTGSQVGSENTTPNKGWLFDSFAERLYAPDGTTAAKRILDWIHPQAILQRDDINQDFYGKGKDTPELIKKSLASIGLSDPDPKVISPWHLYHTGMAHQPVKLNNNVVFTTEKPTKLLQYLAELGQLEPETTFITDEDNMTKVENAGIAHKRIYRVDADTAGPVESNKASLAFQVPSGSYQFYIKQSEAHLPPVTIAGKSISMQKVSDQWWQSDPVAVDGKQSTIETENPKSNQEHVMTFNMHNAWSVEDVGPPPPGQVIPSNFRQDSISEEKNGIDLQSTGHKLMFKTSLTNMEVGHLYQLNFDYKTDENMPGEFSVFMTGTGRIALNEGLPAHTQWQHISRAFRMEPGADVVNVNIFGFTSIPGKVANQFYRNVSVREIVPIESVLIEELTKQPQQQIKVTQPALIKQTPTVAIASIPERTQTEILSYDQNYSPQWLLSGLAGAVPIRTNWYGTAWIIPAGTASKVSLAYSVQRWFSVGLAVSAISLLELVLWFVIHSRVRRHEKSQPD